MVPPLGDREIEEAIVDKLVQSAIGHSGEIGVSVCDGVVTLMGQVDTYAAKCEAEQAAYDVSAVRLVVSHIRLPSTVSESRTDEEIAHAVFAALAADVTVPEERITTTVEDGVVTLRGAVDWTFQRQAAGEAVRSLVGVRGLANLIRVRPHHPLAGDLTVRERIERALVRSARAEMDHIVVEDRGGTVVLRGFVHSHDVRKAAEDAAWLARGVMAVENRLVIRP
jgi:osmotically-inducible protein OsmY